MSYNRLPGGDIRNELMNFNNSIVWKYNRYLEEREKKLKKIIYNKTREICVTANTKPKFNTNQMRNNEQTKKEEET